MRVIAIWLGKITYFLMRLTKHRGAALPGLVAEKLCRNFLAKSLDSLPEGVVIITGTNGKTTSTKMLSSILKNQAKVLTNPTGSNFTRGVASSVVSHSNWSGKLPYDIGVFELDEAYAAKFAESYSPRAAVVLNVMRDQMDRFGEIDHTSRLIGKMVAKTTEFVVLNRDDQRVADMQNDAKCKVFWFGVSSSLRSLFKNDDELHGDKHNKTYRKADCELDQINQYGKIQLTLNNKLLKLNLKAATTYNAQNATAVVLVANKLGINNEAITKYITKVEPAFGRGEHINIEGKKCVLQLVKNPGGFRQALISGKNIDSSATMVVINDDYADGRDVSWLWDVDFKYMKQNFVITSGSRAADMALRLKYDDLKTDLIEPDLLKGLNALLNSVKINQTVIVYTTYTAMLRLRKMISKIAKVEKI